MPDTREQLTVVPFSYEARFASMLPRVAPVNRPGLRKFWTTLVREISLAFLLG
jgi:hypothetical protein